MADDLTISLGNQRQRQRSGIAQRIDDGTLGTGAVFGSGEGGVDDLANDGLVGCGLIADSHVVLTRCVGD
ncbi:MAG TPA: hypothetical protein VGE02_00190 [Gemmatimonadales bacterium]